MKLISLIWMDIFVYIWSSTFEARKFQPNHKSLTKDIKKTIEKYLAFGLWETYTVLIHCII